MYLNRHLPFTSFNPLAREKVCRSLKTILHLAQQTWVHLAICCFRNNDIIWQASCCPAGFHICPATLMVIASHQENHISLKQKLEPPPETAGPVPSYWAKQRVSSQDKTRGFSDMPVCISLQTFSSQHIKLRCKCLLNWTWPCWALWNFIRKWGKGSSRSERTLAKARWQRGLSDRTPNRFCDTRADVPMPTQRRLPGKPIYAAAARAKLSQKGERVKVLSSHGCFCTSSWHHPLASRLCREMTHPKPHFVPTTKL